MNEKFAFKLGSNKEKAYGSVTCMDISDEHHLLAAGFENGHICLWDLKEKKLIKTMTEVHKATVLSVRIWKSSPINFISSDSSGNIQLTEAESFVMYLNVKSKLLFKKSAGFVTCMDALNRYEWSHDILSEDMLNQVVIAMSSMAIVFICCVDPNAEIMFKLPRQHYIKENALSSVAWGVRAIVVHPMRARGFTCS